MRDYASKRNVFNELNASLSSTVRSLAQLIPYASETFPQKRRIEIQATIFLMMWK
jgi:hypothetical protein